MESISGADDIPLLTLDDRSIALLFLGRCIRGTIEGWTLDHVISSKIALELLGVGLVCCSKYTSNTSLIKLVLRADRLPLTGSGSRQRNEMRSNQRQTSIEISVIKHGHFDHIINLSFFSADKVP